MEKRSLLFMFILGMITSVALIVIVCLIFAWASASKYPDEFGRISGVLEEELGSGLTIKGESLHPNELILRISGGKLGEHRNLSVELAPPGSIVTVEALANQRIMLQQMIEILATAGKGESLFDHDTDLDAAIGEIGKAHVIGFAIGPGGGGESIAFTTSSETHDIVIGLSSEWEAAKVVAASETIYLSEIARAIDTLFTEMEKLKSTPEK